MRNHQSKFKCKLKQNNGHKVIAIKVNISTTVPNFIIVGFGIEVACQYDGWRDRRHVLPQLEDAALTSDVTQRQVRAHHVYLHVHLHVINCDNNTQFFAINLWMSCILNLNVIQMY